MYGRHMNAWSQGDSTATWLPDGIVNFTVNLPAQSPTTMTRPLLLTLLFLSAIPASYGQKIERYYTFDWHDTTAVNARFYSLTEKTDSTWHRRDYFLHSLYLQMD